MDTSMFLDMGYDLEEVSLYDLVLLKDGNMFQPEDSEMPYPVGTVTGEVYQSGVENWLVQVPNESGTLSYDIVPKDDVIAIYC